jgi:hypothetical protein
VSYIGGKFGNEREMSPLPIRFRVRQPAYGPYQGSVVGENNEFLTLQQKLKVEQSGVDGEQFAIKSAVLAFGGGQLLREESKRLPAASLPPLLQHCPDM